MLKPPPKCQRSAGKISFLLTRLILFKEKIGQKTNYFWSFYKNFGQMLQDSEDYLTDCHKISDPKYGYFQMWSNNIHFLFKANSRKPNEGVSNCKSYPSIFISFLYLGLVLPIRRNRKCFRHVMGT